jgi:DNA polymerase III epsilon subunit-like protein
MSIRPIVVDLETTGTDIEKDSICQFAAVMVDLDVGKSVTMMSTYCNPGREISPGATEVHGISNEDVVWSPPGVWVLQQFKMLLDSIETAGDDIVICGQNHERFDIPIMRRMLPSAEFGEYLSVDTYTIALREHQDMPHKLSEFYEWYCEKASLNAHDAAADCHLVAAILLKYLKERDISIIDLALEQEVAHVLSHFPFGKHKGVSMEEIPRRYLEWCRKSFTEVHKDVEATICHHLDCDTWVPRT